MAPRILAYLPPAATVLLWGAPSKVHGFAYLPVAQVGRVLRSFVHGRDSSSLCGRHTSSRVLHATGGQNRGDGKRQKPASDTTRQDGGAGKNGATEGAETGLPGVRVNKVFAHFASRREADRYVAAGRVKINGKTAEPGVRVLPGDRVTLDGKSVAWEDALPPDQLSPQAAERSQRRLLYLKYWKPKGVICTTDETVAHNIVTNLGLKERIFPVGRLDKDSTGLILLTNDGRVPNAVLRSSLRHEKLYRVLVHRVISDRDLQQLGQGVMLTTPVQRDRTDKLVTAMTLPCEVRRSGARNFRIALREGRNRQIRRMCEKLGYEVVALHRENVMGIGLDGLAPGQWKPLDMKEMNLIQRALDRYTEAAQQETTASKTQADYDYEE